MDFDASAQVDALAKLPPEPPKPPERSAWTVVPRAITSGMGKIGAAIVEGVAAMSPSEEELRRNPGRTAFSAEDLGLTARSARDYERTLRPDPITAGTAEQVVYGLTSGLTEVAAGAVIAGPAGAAAALGGGEGATVTDDLQRQGVDNRTARMAGAVTGVVNAASVALPLAGPTLKATAGLYVAGGPGGFMAQQAATSAILERAGYDKIAEQFDPLDPLGLALSALVPLPFAAYGARRVVGKSRAADQIAADMAAGRAPDGAALPEVAPSPAAPSAPAADQPATPPASRKGRKDSSHIAESTRHVVDTEDAGTLVVTVHRLKDGGALVVAEDGHIIEHNAAMAGRMTDAELLKYDFEPQGFKSSNPEVKPTAPPEVVDAAMVHNLTLQRQAQEAVPPVARAAEVMRGPVTENPNFRTWFGESKVVDETGKPLVVYHGTKTEFDSFAPNERGLFFAESPGKAEGYAGGVRSPEGGNVVPSYVTIKNPWTYERYSEDTPYSMQKDQSTAALKALGYDGVHMKEDGVWIAFEPTQIKSAIGNSGDFNPASASLTDPRPVPPPAPKPDPAPAPLAETIAKAQEELAAFKASGKTLDEFVAGKELPPAVNNLLIGLAETMKNPARAKALLDMVGKADAKADPANATADAVEAVRALTDDQLTNTPTDPKPAAPDALMQSVSERVAAVELTNPDMPIGMDDSGNPITVRDELARIRKEAFEGTDTELGAADADLVNVAANCALTNGG